MNAVLIFTQLTIHDPLYARELAKAIEHVCNSGLLGFIANQTKTDALDQVDIADPDSQVALQVRAALTQYQTLLNLESALGQIKYKEEDDA